MPPDVHITSDSDLESVISLRETKPKSRRNSVGAKYTCSIGDCGASFKRLTQLDRHEYKHTGIHKHICPYEGCQKSYSIVTHLKRHLCNTHERIAVTQKNVPCDVEGCFKQFQSVSNMKRHLREVHENPKVYHCPHCSEKFTQKLKMRRHEIVKHTRQYPFNCSKCSKGFFQQWQYERHLSGCQVYSCPDCNLQFNKWSLYRKHCKKSNHGRQYYKCSNCTRFYNKPSELEHHIKLRHMSASKEEIDRMQFKCTHTGCERGYVYERNLRQHIRTAHNGQLFSCKETECERVFSSAQNLSKHVQRDHGKHVENKDTTKKSKKRKKRSDAGQPSISHLTKLSGLAINKSFDKLLRQREPEALTIATDCLWSKHETDYLTTGAENDANEEMDRNSPKITKLNSAIENVEHAQSLDVLVSAAFEDD